MDFTALVSTTEQLRAVLRKGDCISRVILDSSVSAPEDWAEAKEQAESSGKQVFFAFPPVFQEKARQYFLKTLPELRKAGFSGFLLRSLEEFAFVRESGLQGICQADHSIYAFNSEAKHVLLSGGFDLLTLPLEHSSKDSRAMGAEGMELIAYGYIPMMVSHNCVHATLEGCDRKCRPLVLIDRLSHEMRHVNDCRFCLSTIYNCVPLYLLDCMDEIRALRPGSLRISFTYESGQEAEAVLRLANEAAKAFTAGLSGPAFMNGNYTRGHFRNSVE